LRWAVSPEEGKSSPTFFAGGKCKVIFNILGTPNYEDIHRPEKVSGGYSNSVYATLLSKFICKAYMIHIDKHMLQENSEAFSVFLHYPVLFK
jgi:hypothetical protein